MNQFEVFCERPQARNGSSNSLNKNWFWEKKSSKFLQTKWVQVPLDNYRSLRNSDELIDGCGTVRRIAIGHTSTGSRSIRQIAHYVIGEFVSLTTRQINNVYFYFCSISDVNLA